MTGRAVQIGAAALGGVPFAAMALQASAQTAAGVEPPPVDGGFVADVQEAAVEWTTAGARLTAAWFDGDLLRTVTLLLVMLMIAAGAELLYWCYAGPALRSLQAARALTPRQRVLVSVQKLALRLFGVILSTGAALGATTLPIWPPRIVAATIILASSVGLLRFVGLLAEFMLSPRSAEHRLWPRPDMAARRMHAFVLVAAATLWLGYAASKLLALALDAPHAARLAEIVGGLLAAVILLAAVAAWSRARRHAVRGGRRRSFADLMPFGAVALIIAFAVLWASGDYQVVWTGLIAAAFAIADICAGAVLHAILRSEPEAEEGEEMPDAMSLATAYEPVIRRFLRLCLAMIAFLSVLAVWHVNVLMRSAAETPMAMIVAQSVNVLVVVLLCDLAWLWVRTFIERQLKLSPVSEGEAASRLSTLLPMIRTAVLIVLASLVVLVALSAMGVNIAPLLAGAGVVGLAIGFGAQTLVRDVITGIFFLIEDAFRVGEYIDVGGRKGTVEAISLRSLRLRHQRGALQTVPFGEIKSLSNESRDWSIVKLEFRIPFETDLAQVKKIIKRINAEIAADPELGPNLLEPLKSQGINRFEEYWMVLRVKYTAKPNSYQFMIRREAYQRIRDAFEKAGIKLGERSVKVEVAGRDSPEDIAAAGSAAEEMDGRAPPARA